MICFKGHDCMKHLAESLGGILIFLLKKIPNSTIFQNLGLHENYADMFYLDLRENGGLGTRTHIHYSHNIASPPWQYHE